MINDVFCIVFDECFGECVCVYVMEWCGESGWDALRGDAATRSWTV